MLFLIQDSVICKKEKEFTYKYIIAGDIGEWQPNGAMKIIDRKKNIFKLSQGEYIAVENIENNYLQCPLIASVCFCFIHSVIKTRETIVRIHFLFRYKITRKVHQSSKHQIVLYIVNLFYF